MAATQNISLARGDSKLLRVTVLNTDDTPAALGGASARWWMAKSVKAVEPDILIQKDSDLGGGIVFVANVVEVSIGSLDTDALVPGRYYHELELVLADSRVATVMIGNFLITPTLIPAAAP